MKPCYRSRNVGCRNNNSVRSHSVDGRGQGSVKSGKSGKSGRSDNSKMADNRKKPSASSYMWSESTDNDRRVSLKESKCTIALTVSGKGLYESDHSGSMIETRYGYCGLYPAWLQRINTPLFLVIFACIYAFIIGFIVNGVNAVIFSNLERRFNLTSKDSGWIAACYNVSAAIMAIVLGKYAKRHKARFWGLVVVCSAVGSFVFALPHFTTGLYKGGLQTADICISPECGDDSALSHYVGVFLFSQLLHGVGGTSLFTVGASLLDDSIQPKSMPLVLGCMYASNIVGLGAGFFLGSKCLELYVDFEKVEEADITLTTEDPSWVGAWWPLYLLSGFIQLCIAIPLFGFGAELPIAEEIRIHRQICEHRPSMVMTEKVKRDREKKHKPVELSSIQTYSILVRNPCFIFIILGIAVEGCFLTGCAAFLSKYIETVYRVPSAKSGIFAGAAIVPAATFGLVSGGLIAKKYDFTILQSLKFIFVMNACSVIGIHCIFMQCDPIKLVGVSLDYTGEDRLDVNDKHLIHQCNQNCADNCSTNIYEPVCSKESGIYFSPCFAGCSNMTIHDSPNKYKSYSNCNCMRELDKDNQTKIAMQQGNFTLTNKDCLHRCDTIFVFAALMFVSMTFSMLPVAPMDTVTFRCVAEEQKSDALGLKTLIVRLFGTLFGPNVVGQLIEMACLVQKESCGSKSSCWVYDPWVLLLALYGFMMVCKSITLFCVAVAHQTYTPPVTKYASDKTNTSLQDTPIS